MIDPRRVLVTGAGGNLGRKIIPALLGTEWCAGVTGVDLALPPGALPADPRVEALAADLLAFPEALRRAVADADAILHLAAQNPYPDASWAEAAASLTMTARLAAEAAAAGKPMRIVFASSNHVMGGYKDEAVAPGALTTDLPPRPGTPAPDGSVTPAYAAAKLMGERLLAATVAANPALTAASLRIGWCQPGDNHPRTISASGTPKVAAPGAEGRGEDAGEARDLAWFRNMWLSNRDLCGTVLAALTADAASWPARAVVVNAMSANAGMAWDLGPTRAWLGYAPQDDAWRALG